MNNELNSKITKEIENGTAVIMDISHIKSLLEEQKASIAEMKNPFILATIVDETAEGIRVIGDVRFSNLTGELAYECKFLEGIYIYIKGNLKYYNPCFFHGQDISEKDVPRKDLIASWTEKYLKHNEKSKEENSKLGRGLKEVDVYVDGQYTSIKMP